MKNKILGLLLISSIFSNAQDYPKGMRSPLNIPITLSANFAKLRANHYHSGLDIRTQQREGLSVYAPEDGYVSRINISPYGYGNAIYITHPNGYTTVYGHLSALVGGVDEKAREAQYKKESFSVDVFFKEGEISVKRGQLIAKTGNSGGSGGPHLHFEVRDSKTEEIINPFLFGYDLKDTMAPIISGVYVFPEEGLANGSKNKQMANASSVMRVSGRVGFGVKATDKQDGPNFPNGIYAINTYVDGALISQFKTDRFAFDESRFINATTDYAEQIASKTWTYKTYAYEGNTLSMFKKLENNGMLDVEPGKTYTIKIEAVDFSGNKASKSFKLIGEAYSKSNIENEATYVHVDKEFELDYKGLRLKFEPKTFYKSFQLDFSRPEVDKFQVGSSEMPVHKNYTLTIDPEGAIDKSKADKYAIVRNSNYGVKKKEFLKTSYSNSKYTAKPNSFGVFSLEIDDTPPTVSSPTLAKTKQVSKGINFTIADTQSGIADFNVYVDGKWILADYDYKTKKLAVRDLAREGVSKGSHTIKVEVTDEIGNKQVYTQSFEKI